MLRRFSLAVVLAGLLGAAGAAAQVYRGGTDVVLLSVTVTDGQGRYIPGLVQNDFRVFEDGVLQDIAHFSDQPEPISLSLLIDTSTSMDLQNKLALAQQAATGFVARLGPRDVAQVIDFDSQTKILAEFTSAKDVLTNALKLVRAGGSTSLYNAIYTSLSGLKRLRGQAGNDVRRQAIVLLSDGEDTSSMVSYDDVLDLAKRSDVTVYAIGIVTKDAPPTRGWNEAEYVMRSVARDSGGRAFFVTDPEQLPSIYQQISEELAKQYSIGYVSKNTKRDGTWRRITLQVLKGDASPRTRAGYYAPSAPR